MTSEMSTNAIAALGLGVVGLGRAFMLTLPSILADKRIRLAGAVDPRVEAREEFASRFSAPAYETLSEMLNNSAVELVYVASPHQLHREHALAALAAGRHVLIEKPVALSLDDSRAIINAADHNNRHVAVGPSHSFDPQIAMALEIIKSGKYGALRMIRANYDTDFMYRPRRAEELTTKTGGGVIFSQAVHHIDIVRLLAGGKTRRVTALTGNWDKARPSEGAYMALLEFENGVTANLTYSGYAHYDGDESAGWMGELGQRKDPSEYGAARRKLRTVKNPEEETALKAMRGFGLGELPRDPDGNEHFGELMLSLDHADIRIGPEKIRIYGDEAVTTLPVEPLAAGRRHVMDAIWQMVRENHLPVQNARWGHATLEVCHAILKSAQGGNWQPLKEQVAVPGYPIENK
ncbi:Gfo/Idh/MocA family protein [Sneathiella sp.]|uniref:Gfo/Idh/MocA family protein n=1 Tax=Sneathiella sp. TaxID=1964365 RepID=UPI0025E2323C|nr:Gfo/Idh/MocA family oxidoreductase [Sneathiella sp.]